MAEVFSATFTPRLRAVKLGAVGADYGQFVNSASIDSRFPALRLTQVHSVAITPAQAGHTVAAPTFTSTTIPLGVANAQTLPEVAAHQMGAKPIGQWQVETDFIATTAQTTELVHLQQNLFNVKINSAFYGFSVADPDFNQTAAANNVDAASPTAGHTADPVVFTQAYTVPAVAAELGITVAAPAITQPSANMGVESAEMAHLGIQFFPSDAVNIDQQHNLGVANADGVCEVAAPTLFLVPQVPTPAERIFIPVAENRTYEVVTESRLLIAA